ncbi:MAG: ferrous iron transporter B, partial [Thermoplasmata archaeon]|nr:ferrous iron transporter B [Thermoplasmata archaeon]
YVKGESPEIFLEIPPYRRPSLKTILKKTWMRVNWFLKEAIPYLILGVLAINVLYAIGFIDWLGNLFAPVMEGLLGLPGEASASLLVGFLRKDLAVGMLLPLGMSPMQLVIATTILTIYFPCVATFVLLFKELGAKDMLKATGLMVIITLIVGTSMRLILIGI